MGLCAPWKRGPCKGGSGDVGIKRGVPQGVVVFRVGSRQNGVCALQNKLGFTRKAPPPPASTCCTNGFWGGWMPGPQWLCPHPAPRVTTSPRPRKPFWDHSPPVAPTAPPRHPMLKAGGSKPVGDKQNKKHHPHPKERRRRAPTTALTPKRLKSFTGAKMWC